MIDFKKINSDCMTIFQSLVSSWITGGKMEGAEYVACNPTRSDKTAGSFKINTVSGVWTDFATGDGGKDPISLYAYINRLSQGDAAKKVEEQISYIPKTAVENKPAQKNDWKIIEPTGDIEPMPTERKYKSGDEWIADKIEKIYPYRKITGELIGYTALCRKKDGGKDVIPYQYCENPQGKRSWRQKGFGAPRPLYNQESLAGKPDAQILMVEGEKCSDYAKKILPDNIVPITWIGGAKSTGKSDLTPLHGRKIVFWADADEAGRLAMLEIYKKISDKIKGGKLIYPAGKPKGWDIADFIDEGADSSAVIKFIKDNLQDFNKSEPAEIKKDDMPFQFLGFGSQQGTTFYYYMPKGTHKVVEMAAAAHSKMNLIGLCDESFFTSAFPEKNGWNVTAAAGWMIRRSEAKGIYDPSKIRGRGAWFDRGRSVLHLGSRLIVDNNVMAIDAIDSEFIYESGISIESDQFSTSNILSAQQASELLKMCDLLSWQNPISSKLYAGWLALAPICGAIDWRPHLWLTGESGTGKTWIQENITAPILGDCCLNASSNTTEPGLRQTLGYDAFPVVFDEIETEDQESFKRVQNIIELARQASSNKNSHIYKGSASGKSVSYAIRSPFLFSSINPKLVQQADKNRITTLKLKKRADKENEEKFEQIVAMSINIINKEWAAKLRGRSIFMIPKIKKNIEIFGKVMSRILQSKRHGDQVGTLLAGAWSLKSDEVIEYSVAEKFCESINWQIETELESVPDHDQCLTVIMQQVIPVNGLSDKRTIGGLIKECIENPQNINDPIEMSAAVERFKQAREALRKYGISTVKNREGGLDLVIAENHMMLSSLLKDSPWHSSYKHVLMRLEGAYFKSAVFADHMRTRAISIPIRHKFAEDDILSEIITGF